MWFTDAAKSCAKTGVTRACVDRFMNRGAPYTADGLLIPVSSERLPAPPKTRRTCVSVARWEEGAQGLGLPGRHEQRLLRGAATVVRALTCLGCPARPDVHMRSNHSPGPGVYPDRSRIRRRTRRCRPAKRALA